MSAISFPSHGHTLDSSTASLNSHEDQYYSPGFDAGASFQMNPLSSHPPRTPKSSIIAHSTNFYHTGYEPSEEQAEEHITAEDLELDEEDERVKQAERKLPQEEVWKDIILTANGRDKVFKVIQYSIRIYLLFHGSISSSRLFRGQKSKWNLNLVQRLTSTASGLSLTRRLLLLFNWLHPLTIIRAQQNSSLDSSKQEKPKSFLHTALYSPPPVLLELVAATADDLGTLSRLGLLGKKTGSRADKFADWCFFFSTLVCLVENSVEKQMITSLQAEVEGRMYKESMTGATSKSKPKISKVDEKELSRLEKQDYWLQVTRMKLLMDLIFVSYSVFNIKKAAATVTTVTGLVSGILSTAKLYEKHKNTLVKSIMTSL